jgi:hypothetical protein
MPAAALLLIAMGLVACGSAERIAARAVPTDVAPAPASTSEEPSRCRIAAVRGEGLEVTPEGGEPFRVAISEGALVFAPTDDGRELAIESEQPLRFAGRARVEDQRLRVRVETDAVAGGVHLVPGVEIIGLSGEESGLNVFVQLGRRSPVAVRGIELAVGPLPLPCDAVIAEPEPEPRSATALVRAVPTGELAVAAALPLVVRPLRAAPAHVEVRPRDRMGFVPVWVVDVQGESARIAIALSDGSRLDGWVERRALREPSAAEAETVDRVIAAPAGEPMGLGVLGAIPPPTVAAGPDEQLDHASLRPGTAIYARAGEGRWAESGPVPIEVRVRWRRGAGFAELVEIPGLWVPLGYAWVRRDELVLP